MIKMWITFQVNINMWIKYKRINLAFICLLEKNYLKTYQRPIPGNWEINQDYKVKEGK